METYYNRFYIVDKKYDDIGIIIDRIKNVVVICVNELDYPGLTEKILNSLNETIDIIERN